MLRFGVVSAYLDEDWHSQRLAEACAALGEVVVLEPRQFGLEVGSQGPRVLAGGRDAREFSVWLTPRALGHVGDPEFQCMIYATLAEQGAPVVNEVGALLAAQDKARSSFLLARAGVPTPEAVAVQSLEEATAALERLGAAVAKPPYGSLGVGVVEVSAGAERAALTALARLLEEHGMVYLQRFAHVARNGHGGARARDLRLFVVGEEIAGALERVAAPGEFRANLHQGARAEAHHPSDETADIAVRATAVLGLAYAGVDLVETDDGVTVIEVNGTPRWDGIREVTGRDMAPAIAAHAASLARSIQGQHVDNQGDQHGR